MEQVIDILESTRELLKSEKSWTQKAIARNKNNSAVLPSEENTVQWCLIGAIDKVTGIKILENETYRIAGLTALNTILVYLLEENFEDILEEVREGYEELYVWEDPEWENWLERECKEIVNWNDDHDTKHADIITTLDHIIITLKDQKESIQ